MPKKGSPPLLSNGRIGVMLHRCLLFVPSDVGRFVLFFSGYKRSFSEKSLQILAPAYNPD